MIVTSNSVTHTINVTSLTKIGQVDSNIDVVNSAFVTIGSTIGYAHTFTKNVGYGDSITSVSITSYESQAKNSDIRVNFNTTGISTFTAFGSLTEDAVINWIPSSTLDNVKKEHEDFLNDAQDKRYFPLKSIEGPADLPWG